MNDPMIERHKKEEDKEYLKYIERINELLFKEEIAAQLAEECTELAHAALKLRRTLMSFNPTPVAYAEARDMVSEELTDLVVCVDVLRYKMHGVKQEPLVRRSAMALSKAKRWAQRLEERDEQEETE